MDAKARRIAAVVILYLLCATALAAPKLEVDKLEWKMGKVPRTETRQTVFTLKNTGDEPIIITQIRPSCKSCLGKIDGDKTIDPGETRPLEVTYKADDAYGERQMSVTIHSNDPEHPLLRLRLSAEVVPQKNRPVLTVRPAQMDVGVVPIARPLKIDVTLSNEGDAPLEVRSVVPSAGLSAGEFSKDAIAPGGKTAIALELVPRARGVIRESVAFETTDPDRPIAEVPIEGYASDTAAPREGIVIMPVLVEEAGKPLSYRVSFLNMTGSQVSIGFPKASGLGPIVVPPGESSTETAVSQDGGGVPEALTLQLVITPAPAAGNEER